MKPSLIPLKAYHPSSKGDDDVDICALHTMSNESGVDWEEDEIVRKPDGSPKVPIVMGPVPQNEKGSLARREVTIDLDDEEDEFETPSDKRLMGAMDIIWRHFWGANYEKHSYTPGSQKALCNKLKEVLCLNTLESASDDLDQALEHLEETLFLMEKYLGRHPHIFLSSEFTEQMEEIANFLADWGMGKHEPLDRQDSILGEVIRREDA